MIFPLFFLFFSFATGNMIQAAQEPKMEMLAVIERKIVEFESFACIQLVRVTDVVDATGHLKKSFSVLNFSNILQGDFSCVIPDGEGSDNRLKIYRSIELEFKVLVVNLESLQKTLQSLFLPSQGCSYADYNQNPLRVLHEQQNLEFLNLFTPLNDRLKRLLDKTNELLKALQPFLPQK
jgi:hypothetical protein